jgi:hypothetical protein
MDAKFRYIGIATAVGPAPFNGQGDATYAVTIFADVASAPGSALTTQC